jgi:hypothetical protein
MYTAHGANWAARERQFPGAALYALPTARTIPDRIVPQQLETTLEG